MGLYHNEMVFSAFFIMDNGCTGKFCGRKEPFLISQLNFLEMALGHKDFSVTFFFFLRSSQNGTAFMRTSFSSIVTSLFISPEVLRQLD